MLRTLVYHYSINLSLGVDLLKKKKVLVNMGYGVLHELNYFLTHCHVVVHCLEMTVMIVTVSPACQRRFIS